MTGPREKQVISTRWQLSDCRRLRSWNSSTSTLMILWSYRSTLRKLVGDMLPVVVGHLDVAALDDDVHA